MLDDHPKSLSKNILKELLSVTQPFPDDAKQ
jgi:hypothetical protein